MTERDWRRCVGAGCFIREKAGLIISALFQRRGECLFLSRGCLARLKMHVGATCFDDDDDEGEEDGISTNEKILTLDESYHA